MSELDEQVGREGLIAADAFRLGDEAEQLLRVAGRECRHGLTNDTTNPEWTPLAARASWVRRGSVAA